MKEINEETRSSIEEVTGILERGNFQTVKKSFGKEKLKRLLAKLHPKYTIQELETITGIPDSTLIRWFKELGRTTQDRWHISMHSRLGKQDSIKIKKVGNRLAKQATVKITPELSYVIGFALGDGTIQNYMVEVFNKDEGLRPYLYGLLKSYGTISEDRREDGLWRLRLSSVKIANLIKKNRELNKETITYIFKQNRLARKFVAAFWDAEGSVRREKRYFHIYLYNSDTYLLEKVEEFLNRRKIEHSSRYTFQPNREYYLKGRRVISKKKIYRISIPKSSMKKWAMEIGVHMLHTKKKLVVQEILDCFKEDR
jgi:hypothetical protein